MKKLISSWTRFKQSLPAILASLEGGSGYQLDRLDRLELELAEVKSSVGNSQPACAVDPR